jgi:hypothetical protein
MTHRLHRLAKGLRQEVVAGGDDGGRPSGSGSRRGGPAGRTRSRRLPSLARTRPPVGGVRIEFELLNPGDFFLVNLPLDGRRVDRIRIDGKLRNARKESRRAPRAGTAPPGESELSA